MTSEEHARLVVASEAFNHPVPRVSDLAKSRAFHAHTLGAGDLMEAMASA